MRGAAVVCGAMLVVSSTARGATFVVAPDGPLATLDRARQAVREWRKANPDRKEPVRVQLRGGTYRPSEPITFTPDDSGSAEAPVVYEAYKDERPVVSGGVRITGWQVRNGRWRVMLPEVRAGTWRFSQLFVDGQRRYRPRVPANGYYAILGGLPKGKDKKRAGPSGFRFTPGQLRAHWRNLNDVEVLVFNSWSMSRNNARRGADRPTRRPCRTANGCASRSPSPWAPWPTGPSI
jgi:hypothetical protein